MSKLDELIKNSQEEQEVDSIEDLVGVRKENLENIIDKKQDYSRVSVPASSLLTGEQKALNDEAKELSLAEKRDHAKNLAQNFGDEILAKRREGHSIAEIAKQFNTSKATIHKIVQRELDRLNDASTSDAKYVKKLMENRLEDMYKAIYPNIQAGVFRAIEMGIKIMERQAKLAGIDAAEKKQVDINVELSTVEIIRNAERLGIAVPPELRSLGNTPLVEDVIEGEIVNAVMDIDNAEEET